MSTCQNSFIKFEHLLSCPWRCKHKVSLGSSRQILSCYYSSTLDTPVYFSVLCLCVLSLMCVPSCKHSSVQRITTINKESLIDKLYDQLLLNYLVYKPYKIRCLNLRFMQAWLINLLHPVAVQRILQYFADTKLAPKIHVLQSSVSVQKSLSLSFFHQISGIVWGTSVCFPSTDLLKITCYVPRLFRLSTCFVLFPSASLFFITECRSAPWGIREVLIWSTSYNRGFIAVLNLFTTTEKTLLFTVTSI